MKSFTLTDTRRRCNWRSSNSKDSSKDNNSSSNNNNGSSISNSSNNIFTKIGLTFMPTIITHTTTTDRTQARSRDLGPHRGCNCNTNPISNSRNPDDQTQACP